MQIRGRKIVCRRHLQAEFNKTVQLTYKLKTEGLFSAFREISVKNSKKLARLFIKA